MACEGAKTYVNIFLSSPTIHLLYDMIVETRKNHCFGLKKKAGSDTSMSVGKEKRGIINQTYLKEENLSKQVFVTSSLP